jgi:hypothetical protein
VDVFARGVDGGAVLVENVRDYAGEDYFNLITYARQGKEFGSVHRNDEVLSCGLLRDVRFLPPPPLHTPHHSACRMRG